jgi:hypothetical protein
VQRIKIIKEENATLGLIIMDLHFHSSILPGKKKAPLWRGEGLLSS